VDEHDKKNAAKVARVKKDPSADRDMQPAESGVAVGTPKEGPSSPRYKKEWDIQQFIATVSDPRAFLASDFAYPEERMIVTRENYVDIMKERLGARTSRALPASYPYPRTKGKSSDSPAPIPATVATESDFCHVNHRYFFFREYVFLRFCPLILRFD
jgi:hypothetical protein